MQRRSLAIGAISCAVLVLVLSLGYLVSQGGRGQPDVDPSKEILASETTSLQLGEPAAAVGSLPFLWRSTLRLEVIGSTGWWRGQFSVMRDCVVFTPEQHTDGYIVAVSDQLVNPLRENGSVLRVPFHYIDLDNDEIYEVFGEPIGGVEQLPDHERPAEVENCPSEGYLVAVVRQPDGSRPDGSAVVTLVAPVADPTVDPISIHHAGRQWTSDGTETELVELELVADTVDDLPGWELWSTFSKDVVLLLSTDGLTRRPLLLDR